MSNLDSGGYDVWEINRKVIEQKEAGQNVLKNEYCIGCGTRLIWGKFAYKQELCWDCFENKVNYIIQDIKGTDNVDIIKHLLNITKLFAAKWR